MKQIKTLNPSLDLYFGVRGKPVVNDSIESDAYFVGIDEAAKIISNGDVIAKEIGVAQKSLICMNRRSSISK